MRNEPRPRDTNCATRSTDEAGSNRRRTAAQNVLSDRCHAPAGARRPRWPGPCHHLFPFHRQFVDVHAERRDDNFGARLAARHPRNRRRFAHDRRRVRSLDRLHDRLYWLGLRCLSSECALAPLSCHRCDAGVRVRSRRDQRTARHPDEASVLHRHAGVSVHPARPHPGRIEVRHGRFDPVAGCRRGGSRRRGEEPVFGRRLPGTLLVARGPGSHREIRHRPSKSQRRARIDHLVHRFCDRGDLGPVADAGRQLDLRRGRRCECGAQFRRSGEPREDWPFHVDRLRCGAWLRS